MPDEPEIPSRRAGNHLHFVLTATSLLSLGWFGCGRSANVDDTTRVARADIRAGSSQYNAAISTDVEDAFTAGSEGLAQLRQSGPSWFTDRDDPGSDGWDSEVFSQRVSAQLKVIAKSISYPDQIDSAPVEKLTTAEFACAGLRPTPLEVVFQDPLLTVSRSADIEPLRPGVKHSGSPGPTSLAEALRELIEPLASAQEVRAKFKLFRVTPDDSSVTTQAFYEASGHGKTGTVQQNAVWTCQWTPVAEGQPPRLASIRIDDYEEVVTHGPPTHLFSDCSQAVMGQNSCFSTQLMHGQAHWIKRMQSTLGVNNNGHQGLAIGDVDGDGLEDIYVPQSGGLPNRLFRQNADGTATDVAADAGVDFMERTNAALFLDLDNDGDQDLVMATLASILVLGNDGTGNFTRTAELPSGSSMALATADIDNDGDLDLYACKSGAVSIFDVNAGSSAFPIPYHDANNGAPNVLYRNDGNWSFSDVTSDVGLDMNNRRWSLAASWEDYDNDGDVDLYVANDYGRNNLYRNDAGHFTDVAAEAGVEDMAAGMSVSWGDYNRDGWMDLYVGNMFSAAGNRVTFQRRFQAQATEATKGRIQRLVRGNTLFLNSRDGTFRDVSQRAAVTMGRWAWSSVFVDVNNDGWEDLVVANGYFSNQDPNDL